MGLLSVPARDTEGRRSPTPAPTLLNRAKEAYPYLRDKPLAFVTTYDPREKRLLEFWNPGESGTRNSPRPSDLPLDTPGIQVFSKSVRPIDVLGDYVSHYGVQQDPVLNSLYRSFQRAIPDEIMQQRYAYHKTHLGESRPYEVWKEQTEFPEYLRNYVFDQGRSKYPSAAIPILNAIRQYVGVDAPDLSVHADQDRTGPRP